MGMLRWVETDAGTSRPFLKAEIVNLNLDFLDICEGRFWGGHNFWFQLKFSIHERIIKDKGWSHQLLAPNGIHIYCRSVEEAKEIAEQMFERIARALMEQINRRPAIEQLPEGEVAKKLNKALDFSKMTTEQFNHVMYKKFCRNTKHKIMKLSAIAENRGINGRIWYSRLRGSYGWMFSFQGGPPQLLGSNYEQAVDMLNSGTFDFYKAG